MGFLGGAAVAGPSMAKQAVTGLDAMVLTNIPLGPESPYEFGPQAIGKEYDHATWLKKQIASITGLTDAERQERINERYVGQLDPDLAVNRSFSLAAKIRMQKERDHDRMVTREHRSLTRQLAEHLASVTGL